MAPPAGAESLQQEHQPLGAPNMTNYTNTKNTKEVITGRLIEIKHERDNWFAGTVFTGTKNIRVSGPVTIIPAINSTVSMTGVMVNNPQYGQQFKFDSLEAQMPTDRDGVISFLETVPTIGKIRAAKIVDLLGLDAIEKIIKEPLIVTKIKGIGPKSSEEIRKDLEGRKTLIECESILVEMGVHPKTRRKLAESIGSSLVNIIKEDPYTLIVYEGITFALIDRYVLAKGIFTPDHPQRGAAICIEGLKMCAEEGHTYSDITNILRQGLKIKLARPCPREVIEKGIEIATEKGLVVEIGTEIYALSHYDQIERNTAIIINEWLENGYELGSTSLITPEALKMVTDEQMAGITNAIRNRFCVITGGPGVGKTWTSTSILSCFSGASIAIVAPTGKAAKRASEVTGFQASTIHRFIGKIRSELEKDEVGSPEDVVPQVVLCDESSMVDASLFYQLVSTLNLRKDCRLIVVGDVDQLPSIGAGCVLSDLINSGVVPVARLTKVHRQGLESNIIKNAYKINNGDVPDNSYDSQKKDWMYVRMADSDDAVENAKKRLANLLTDYCPKNNIDPIKEVQIMTGQRRSVLGVNALNDFVRSILNPASALRKELIRERKGNNGTEKYSAFREGDKVMCIENDYNLGIVNGDQGIVENIMLDQKGNKSNDMVNVRLDSGELVTFKNEDLNKLAQSWAITVHKSQGSEYKIAVFFCHDSMAWALQRSLLYTAVTRAKQTVVLFGTDKALDVAVKAETKDRFTQLQKLLTAS
jgi:exodeoxyribonuclease V alpha subunit